MIKNLLFLTAIAGELTNLLNLVSNIFFSLGLPVNWEDIDSSSNKLVFVNSYCN
jgi:hypothetical protein